MAVYYKPQSPIQSGEDFIYPITTADQVKVDKDTRLNAVGVYLKNIDNSTDTTVYGNNATTLGGVAAEDYALKTDTAPDSSKLGGVAASDYALKTDTAPDSSKLGGKVPEYYLQPRNLLDNSDFRNPVNQRGLTTYNHHWEYTIDRWIIASISTDGVPSLDITNSGITITNTTGNIYFIQRVPKALITFGNTYTYAYQKSDGTIVVTTGASFEEIGGESYQIVYVIPSGTTIVWAALYEGSYTAETLPPYVPKGYAAELAECQRYYRRGGQAVTIGKLYSGGGIFSLYFPKMRIYPTINILEISSQGWGNVDASNYTQGWGDDYGCEHYVNFTSSITDDVGKTVIVKYECSANL